MLRKLLLCLVFALPIVAARPASAQNNSGRIVGATVSSTFFTFSVTQAPDVTWTFATSNLSAGSDTVIHVQNWDDIQGGYIAGNDDYIGLASQVTVPPVSTSRNLFVIVRSYSQTSQGTCDVTATSSPGGPVVYPSRSFGGSVYYVGDLPQSAHVMTVERQGGTNDTLVLTVGGPNGEASHAVAYDDDDGVGLMSFVHNNEFCLGCSIVVANFDGTGASTADLVWDADADSTDWDGDGLGASLEAVICEGTTCLNSSVADTDQDGLKDGTELLGQEVAGVPLKLPTWGADPLQKDLFVEHDWQKCFSSDPGLCPQGTDSGKMGTGKTDADFQSSVVDKIKQNYDPANVRIHLDVGRANTNPANWYDWGDWGGATQVDVTPNPQPACLPSIGASFERAFSFHHAVTFPPESATGYTCFVPGPYFATKVNDALAIPHELGHTLGLYHGGRPNKISINFKPQYVSIMNYLYEASGVGFSHGDSPVVSLNPTALDESVPLTTNSLVLNKLRDTWCPVRGYNPGLCVNLSSGTVDWDRDGIFAPAGTTVQGTVSEVFFSRSARTFFKDPTMADPDGHGILRDPSLTWVSVGGAVGDQLWSFGRDGSNQLVWARTPRTTLNTGCGSFSSFEETSTYNCAQFGNASGISGMTTLVPGPKVLAFAPGAAEYNAQILVVFQGTTGTMTSKLITINNSNGSVTYGADVQILQSLGGVVATGDITALSTATGVVTVWAPTGSGTGKRLREFRFQNNAWSDQGNQLWTNGTSLLPVSGIGATRGFQDGSSTPSTYAAIPMSPDGRVEFVIKSNSSPFRWSKVTFTCSTGFFGCDSVTHTASSWAGTGGAGLPTDNPPGTQPLAAGRPGLAYQRRAGQPNSVGRFYMAINQGASCSGPFGTTPACADKLIMTEGNLSTGTPTTRRLTWIAPAHELYQPENAVVGGISLVDDVTRDANLRAAFGVGGHGILEPLADGIINASLSDMDDFPYVTGALRAALCMDGGTWPDHCVLLLP